MMSQLAKLSRLKRQLSGKGRLISRAHGGIDPSAGIINEKKKKSIKKKCEGHIQCK